MTAERYQQIADLFHAAQQVEPERRNDFLLQACKGDDQLRIEVAKLLAGQEDATKFLSAPAVVVAMKSLADEKPQSLIGKRLGRFEILSLLGAGGMGEVYLAKDAQLGRKVALKLLPQEFTSQSDRLRRFEREARAASALNHPNIITIHDIGEADGIHFIATEYIEGEMLRRRMMQGSVPLREAVGIAIQVANALEVAHAAGIIHRDIKPENIMLRPDGIVKVLDFGLAKLTEPDKALSPVTSPMEAKTLGNETSAGMIIGTVNYMSPEQARGLRVDRRSDIWSLGVTLYEMVVGKSPFTGQTATDVLISIVDREPARLTRIIPDVPADLERIVMKSLAKNCDERYQSAREMARDLESLKRYLETNAAFTKATQIGIEPLAFENELEKSSAASEKRIEPVKKTTASPTPFVIAGLLLIIIGLGVWLVWRSQPTTPSSNPVSSSTPAPNPPATSARQISYSLLIQKMITGKDGKATEDGKPYPALEQSNFGGSDRFNFTFSSPQDGYLYLLNESKGKSGEQSYFLLLPSPSVNNGSAKVTANQIVSTGRYLFDLGKPIEPILLVWAAQPVEELEAVKGVVNEKDFGQIKDPVRLAAVKQFLEKHQKSTNEAVIDEATKQTTVRGSGDVIIHRIKLTHQ